VNGLPRLWLHAQLVPLVELEVGVVPVLPAVLVYLYVSEPYVSLKVIEAPSAMVLPPVTEKMEVGICW